MSHLDLSPLPCRMSARYQQLNELACLPGLTVRRPSSFRPADQVAQRSMSFRRIAR